MRKFLLMFSAVLLLGPAAYAQTRTVSGTVTEGNYPLAGVTVVVQGTQNAAVTDPQGNYTLNQVPVDGTIEFRHLGMATQVIPVAGRIRIDVGMETDATVIDDVVVTAMGIARSEKSLGYSVSQVSGDEITKARESNIINSLAGRVAGLHVTPSSGTAGGGSRIIIRGQSSLGNAGQPLFIIDGQPVSNQSYNPTGINGSIDVGNRMGDIAGDDIESISVLKGAAATALYGARAKDGAVVITTKKGAKGRVMVSVNSTVRFENPLVLPNFQDSYVQGAYNSGAGKYEYNYGSQNGWGPHISTMEGVKVQNFLGEEVYLQMYPDNVKDFFNTGHTYINNVSISGGDEKNDFRVGLTADNQDAIFPGNTYDRYNFTFNGGRNFSDKLSARVSMTYSRTQSEGRPAQGSNDVNVIMPSVYRTPKTVSMQLLRDNYVTPEGTQGTVNQAGSSGNLFWTIYRNKFTSGVDRFFGSATINYEPVKGLNISNSVGQDYFNESRRKIYAKGTVGAIDGGFITDDITDRIINNDLIVSYEKTFDRDWDFKIMAGHNLFQHSFRYITMDARQLNAPNLYTYANAATVAADEVFQKSRLVGLWGDVSLGYRNMVFLNLTGRNDWSSTMPKSHRSYFYPSANASFIFTELFQSRVLSFGKFRVSYANVGSDTDPYQLDYYFYPESSIWMQFALAGLVPHGGVNAFSSTATFPDPNLQPQNQSSFEIGTDLRFFERRLRLDLNYYYSKTTRSIARPDISQATGYFYMRGNVGTISNEGIEILLSGTPVQTRHFNWNIDVTFGTNRQKVLKLDMALPEYPLASGYESAQIKAKEGEAFSLYGTYWLRDDDGNFIISANGTRIKSSDSKNLGKVAPDWTMGIGNTLSYQGIVLSFLVDFSKGGTLYSGTVSSLRTGGMAKETMFNDREAFIDNGVTTSGAENTTKVSAYSYWVNNYSTAITEANTFDASFIKLREVVLSYQLPQKWFDNFFIKSASVGFEGRNLWLIKSNVPHIDPEVSLFGPSSVGSGIEFYSVPSSRSLGFNVKLTF